MLAAGGDVISVFGSGHAVFHLLDQGREDLTQRDVAALSQLLAEQDEGGALDQGVVDVKERCRAGVLGDVRVRLVELWASGGGKGATDGINTKGEFFNANAKGFLDGGCGGRFAGGALRLCVEWRQCQVLKEAAQVAVGDGPLGKEFAGLGHGVPRLRLRLVI